MSEAARHGLRGQADRILRVTRFVWPYARGRVAATFALLMAAGLTEGVSILLFVPVLAALAPGGGGDLTFGGVLPAWVGGPLLDLGLAPLLALMAVAVILQALLSRLSTLTLIDTALTVANAVRARLFETVGFARWGRIMTARHADISHALTMDVDRIQAVLNSLLYILQAVLMLVLYIGLSFLVSPAMTAAAVVAGALFLAALHPLRAFASRYGEALSQQRQVQYRTIGEFLGGLKFVKSINAEARYVQRFIDNSAELTQGVRQLSRVAALPGLLFQAGSAVGAALFIYVAYARLDLPVEQIAVMLFLFLRVSPRFTSLQTHYHTLILNVGGYDTVREVLQVYEDAQEPPAAGPATRLPLERAITLEHVAFRYGPEAELVLDDVSFALAAGEITALIGASGSGKSTTADLLLGLLEPTTGVVRIDGVALDAETRRRFREGVAYVPQEVYLANGSIRYNLTLAAPLADDAAMWRALEQAQAAEVVRRLSGGLDGRIADQGVGLSGGERQRIALARALLRDPDLLVLDEATSALDWRNQQLIARAVEDLRGRMTVVTIAHRPSMIGFADRLIALEAGRVVEVGRYAELAARPDSRLSRLLAGEGGGPIPDVAEAAG